MGVIEFDTANSFVTGTGAASSTPQSLDTFIEAIENTTLTRGVWIKNDSGSSTNKILIKENKDAAGYPLSADQSVFVQINDLRKVFVVAAANTPTFWFQGS